MNKFFGTIEVLCVLLACISATLATNYCDPALCGRGVTHIGCKNSGKFGPKCTADAKFLPLTPAQIDQFLDAHNVNRALVASGSLAGYSAAKNMPVVEWDKELAYLAGLNVKTCVSQHDKCRATKSFKFSGQNLASSSGKPTFPDVDIASTVKDWFNEHVDGSMENINKCGTPSKGVIGHFTALVADRTTKIGCAIVRFTGPDGWKNILYACNYSFTNMVGQPIYISGPAASGCAKGRSTKYVGLCNP